MIEMKMPYSEGITILKCCSKKAVKEFFVNSDKKITKKSFGSEWLFEVEEILVSNLQDILGTLEKLQNKPDSCIIRGRLKEGITGRVRRKLHGNDAAFEPVPRRWVVFDLDKLPCPAHLNPANDPEGVARWAQQYLPPVFWNVSCIYKYSSSQNVPQKLGESPSSTVSLHLIFECDKPVSEDEWKRFLKANPCPVDKSLFSAVQIHYTAAPIFHGMDDPLPKRLGLLMGTADIVIMPPIPEAKPPAIKVRESKDIDVPLDRQDKAVSLLADYYIEGVRDRLCAAVAGALYRGGWQADDVADFILKLADSCGDEEAEARYKSAHRICDSVDDDRPAPGIPVLKDELCLDRLDEILELLDIGNINIDKEISQLSSASTPKQIEKILERLIPLSMAERQIYLEKIYLQTKVAKGTLEKILKSVIQSDKKFLSSDKSVLIVEQLLHEYYEGGRLLLKALDDNFWTYTGKNWEIAPEDSLRQKLLSLAVKVAIGRDSVSGLINSALSILNGRVYRDGDPLRFKADPPMVINCRNGELWFDQNGEVSFRPHNPESYLKHFIDVDYNPVATSPRFEAAFLEIFSKSSDPEGMFRHAMEVMGYFCQPWRKIAVILLFIGYGSNGKTSLIKITERLLGSTAMMWDRMSEVEKSPFKVGALATKLVLVDDDVDAGTCIPDGFLKKASEEKTMSGQHKHRNPFEFICRAVPVMLANEFPAMRDLSFGIRRRMMVIPFNRTFSGREMKIGLFDDIWKEEASGILNHAINGFCRLKKRGYFFEPKDCITSKQEWIARSNIFANFVEEHCEKGSDKKQRVNEFYDRLQKFYEASGATKNIPTRQGAKERLQAMGYDIKTLDGYPVVRGLYAPDPLETGQSGALFKHRQEEVVESEHF